MTTQLKETYQATLRKGLCEVVFTKANGDERQMVCTLHQRYIDSVFTPSGNPNAASSNETVTASSNETDDVVTVWDTDAHGWRRFRIDAVVEAPNLIEEWDNG